MNAGPVSSDDLDAGRVGQPLGEPAGDDGAGLLEVTLLRDRHGCSPPRGLSTPARRRRRGQPPRRATVPSPRGRASRRSPACSGGAGSGSGVPENRGAGAGCGTPRISRNVARGHVVRMRRRLDRIEDGCDARVERREVLLPVVARPRADHCGEALAQDGPPVTVVLVGERLDWRARDPRAAARRTAARSRRRRASAPSARLVAVVPGRAGVEQVRAARAPEAGRARRVERRQHHRGAVDHRGVDDLSRTGALAREQRGDDAVRQEHPAAREVGEHVDAAASAGRRRARAARARPRSRRSRCRARPCRRAARPARSP